MKLALNFSRARVAVISFVSRARSFCTSLMREWYAWRAVLVDSAEASRISLYVGNDWTEEECAPEEADDGVVFSRTTSDL